MTELMEVLKGFNNNIIMHHLNRRKNLSKQLNHNEN